jgi:hypothetical protein
MIDPYKELEAIARKRLDKLSTDRPELSAFSTTIKTNFVTDGHDRVCAVFGEARKNGIRPIKVIRMITTNNEELEYTPAKT